MIARQLAALQAQVYASPRYLERAGVPKTPEDLASHECLSFPKGGHVLLQSGAATSEVKIGGTLRAEQRWDVPEAGHLDQGIILLPRAAVAKDLEAGRLQQVPPE